MTYLLLNGLGGKNRTCATWSQTTGDAISLIGVKVLDRKCKMNLSRQEVGITSGLNEVLDCGQDCVLVDIEWAACSLASSSASLSSSDATGC